MVEAPRNTHIIPCLETVKQPAIPMLSHNIVVPTVPMRRICRRPIMVMAKKETTRSGKPIPMWTTLSLSASEAAIPPSFEKYVELVSMVIPTSCYMILA